MAVLKELILTVSTLGMCGSLERTEFNSFYFRECVVVMKKLDLTVLLWQGCGGLESPGFNSFYFGRVWWSRKN